MTDPTIPTVPDPHERTLAEIVEALIDVAAVTPSTEPSAVAVANLVAEALEVVSVELGSVAEKTARAVLRIGELLDGLETKIDAGFEVRDLALAAVAPKEKPRPSGEVKLVFGMEVELLGETDVGAVQEAIARMEPGLDSRAVVDRLERDGLVRRVDQ